MRSNIFAALAIIGLAFVVSGCGTPAMKTSVSEKVLASRNGGPIVFVSEQGFIPATAIYRTSWPVTVQDANPTNARMIPPELIAPIVQGAVDAATGAGKDYWQTMQMMHSYRRDVLVAGYTNLTEQGLQNILENATQPHTDAGRSAFQNGSK